MNHHTIVCGTSKSKEEDCYYIKEKEKFWGSLHKARITEDKIVPCDYRELGKKYGIYLTEIVDEIVSQDQYIKVEQVKEGLEKLLPFIEREKPKRILFHGKRAAAWFWQWTNKNKKITKSTGHITKKFDYGFQLNWTYNNTKIYILPSTSGAAGRWWDEDKWIEAWQDCLDDVQKFKSYQKR